MAEMASLLPLIQGTAGAVGGYTQYSASMAEGRYAERVGNMNAQIAARQAGEARDAGAVESNRRMRQGVQDAESAKVRAAANNLNPSTGAPARVQEDILDAAIEDSATIQKNAALQAWGFGMDSINSKFRGRMGKIAAKNEAGQSIISGGLQFARYGLEAYDRSSGGGGTTYVRPPSGKKMSDVRNR